MHLAVCSINADLRWSPVCKLSMYSIFQLEARVRVIFYCGFDFRGFSREIEDCAYHVAYEVVEKSVNVSTSFSSSEQFCFCSITL